MNYHETPIIPHHLFFTLAKASFPKNDCETDSAPIAPARLSSEERLLNEDRPAKDWCKMAVPLFHEADPGAQSSALRLLLRAAATFRRDEEPELFAHIHPHGHASAKLARRFATAKIGLRGMAGTTFEEIEFGAYAHDIGKYLISKSILLKPGPLSGEERAVMSHHPVYGAQILSNLAGITEPILQIVRQHHERWDGAGYPEGLSGTRISLAARIVSVVDAYTALRAKRSYKPRLTKHEAFRTLYEMAGRELDPYLVEDFIRLVGHPEKKL